MGYPIYYPEANDILPILFDTYDGGTGASITLTGLAVTDIEIYKDGSVTQRASDAGYTLLDTDGIDFDALTGIHGFSIDLSDNTDAGFYAVGPWYHVVVSSVTVDAQTVSFIAAAFRIVSATRGLAGTALPAAAADAAGGLPISDAGGLDLDARIDAAITTRLAPTVAGRTLDVTATGEAGLDLDNTAGALGTAQFDAAFLTAALMAADAVDEILDEVIEGTLTLRQMCRLFLAALAGKTTGGGLNFRDNADLKDRIAATVDASNNRTTVTLDPT